MGPKHFCSLSLASKELHPLYWLYFLVPKVQWAQPAKDVWIVKLHSNTLGMLECLEMTLVYFFLLGISSPPDAHLSHQSPEHQHGHMWLAPSTESGEQPIASSEPKKGQIMMHIVCSFIVHEIPGPYTCMLFCYELYHFWVYPFLTYVV